MSIRMGTMITSMDMTATRMIMATGTAIRMPIGTNTRMPHRARRVSGPSAR